MLDRVSKQVLDQLAARSAAPPPAGDHHQQFLDLSEWLDDQDRMIAESMCDLKRSNATWRLASWLVNRWLTRAEFDRLGQETRTRALVMAELDRYPPDDAPGEAGANR